MLYKTTCYSFRLSYDAFNTTIGYMMRLIRYIFLQLYLFFVPVTFIFADVSTIYLFVDARDLFEKADASTLIILDVNSCLIQPIDYCLKESEVNSPIVKEAWKDLIDSYKELENPKKLEYRKSQILEGSRRQVYETTLRKMIYKNKSEKKGGRFMALTSERPGQYGVINAYDEWLFNMLKRHGYDFSIFSSKVVPKFDEKPFKNEKPLLYQGILFANHLPLLDVLESFLDHTMKPGESVLFFHKSRSLLMLLDAGLKDKPYKFQGIHYKKYDPNPFSLGCEREIFDYQLNFLMLHDEWLDEARVRSILNFGF